MNIRFKFKDKWITENLSITMRTPGNDEDLISGFLFNERIIKNISEIQNIEKKGEIVLINAHIASYKQASYSNHNPMDERKLLLNKREINKLIGKMQRDGFTIVPTKMYFKKGKAKIELAIAKGKKQFDKRATKKNRDWNRDKARYIRKSS